MTAKTVMTIHSGTVNSAGSASPSKAEAAVTILNVDQAHM
jgi:hypothetical protein